MAQEQKINLTFKFLLVGDMSVGKTCIVNRLVKSSFDLLIEPTVCVDFLTHVITIDDTPIKLQIWDTAGQERYRSLGRAYYRNAVGVFFVFSLANHTTFENIEKWVKDVVPLCHPKAQVAIVGNKDDMVKEREVTASEAKDLAANLNIPYYETSAKTGSGISEIFLQAARKIYNKVKTNEITVDQEIRVDIDSEDEEQNEKHGCCK